MINQSEMYRISGGCVPDRVCRECDNFVFGKKCKCLTYPKEFNGSWKGDRMACKFFYKNEDKDQMTIMDFLKGCDKSG